MRCLKRSAGPAYLASQTKGSATDALARLDRVQRALNCIYAADAIAKAHGRPPPTRGRKNVATMGTIIAEARARAAGGSWVEALSDLLVRFYRRDDPFLVDHSFPLSLALQPTRAGRSDSPWRAPRARLTEAERQVVALVAPKQGTTAPPLRPETSIEELEANRAKQLAALAELRAAGDK